jgi:hypothetical protein
MRRVVLIVLLLLGAAMIVTPLAMGMFSKTSDAEQMMNDFRPIMQPASIAKTVYYQDQVFAKLRPMVPLASQQNIGKFQLYTKGMQSVQSEVASLVPTFAQAMRMPPAQLQAMLAKQFPALAQLFASMPTMNKDFTQMIGALALYAPVLRQVPAGLDHYKPIVEAVAQNGGNFRSADSLPRMGLFPWFFIIPGALIVLLSGWLLVDDGLLHVHLPTRKAAAA